MAGRGRLPKDESARRGRVPLVHGWQQAEGEGWCHGRVPEPPEGLSDAAVKAWHTWFGAWFAWFWEPADLPGLELLVKLYDRVDRGFLGSHGELRITMDTFGITPKGQMDRRWRRCADVLQETAVVSGEGRWADLKVVDGGA